MLFQIAGFVNAALVILSTWGIWLQLRKVLARKLDQHIASSTDILSLNQFSASFWAYFAFFVFGYTLEPFNHYLVWPRLLAASLVLMILLEIARDRASNQSKWAFLIAGISLLLGTIGLVSKPLWSLDLLSYSSALIIVITALLAQGYLHQIMLVLNSKRTGAIDIRMSLFILLKDLSTVVFALAMDVAQSWPLIFLASVSGITKVILIGLYWRINDRVVA